jgi:hypothetical protein
VIEEDKLILLSLQKKRDNSFNKLLLSTASSWVINSLANLVSLENPNLESRESYRSTDK